MTTAAPAPPLAPTPAALKAPPTSSTTSKSATGFNARPAQAPSAPPHPPSSAAGADADAAATAAPPPPTAAAGQGQGQGPRRTGRPGLSDPLSDKATAFLIRKILCPQQLAADKGRASPAPIEELLPPLTSRNDVDLQLYAIIAIILREFVQTWYNTITPDETFVAEIVQIIAHCTRALEQRLRKVDLESLLFDELPELLDRHVQAYRAAHDPDPMIRPPMELDPRQVYHSLCPLPALSPVPRPHLPHTVSEQEENEVAYRQLLVRGVLAILLPTEDLENECLTALVGQIFSELIIGGVIARKAAEPWMIWEGLIILARVIRQKLAAGPAAAPPAGGDARAPDNALSTAHPRPRLALQRAFWLVVHMGFAAFALIKFLVATVAVSRSLPSRRRAVIGVVAQQQCDDDMTRHKAGAHSPHEADAIHHHYHPAAPADETRPEPLVVPVVAFRLWPAASRLLELDARKPWLCGAMSMLQWIALTGPGQVAGVDGVLDRLLSHSIRSAVLDPSLLPPLLRGLRAALFPNNAPGASMLLAPSSDAEVCALRRRCASALWGLAPSGRGATATALVGRVLFGVSGRTRPVGRAAAAATAAPSAALSSSSRSSPPRSGPMTNDSDRGVGYSSNSNSGGRNGEPGGYGDERARGPRGGDGGGAGEGDDDVEDQDEPILAAIDESVLDVFSDVYCNKHLMYSVLELVLVRLMPELSEKGIVELWEERLS